MPESYSYDEQRSAPRDPGLRAGDPDRDAVADVLRDQHLAGRLDTDELQERLDRCYAAKTYGELEELVDDLPGTEPARPLRRPWRWPAIALLPVVIAAIVLSRGQLLWLAIPVFFFLGRPLIWRSAGRGAGWGLVGRGAPCGSPSSRWV
jgi:hypothetical protein